MTLLLVELDADVAGHLAMAVRRHREFLKQVGRACPPELVELDRRLIDVAEGQGVSGVVRLPAADSVSGVNADWLSAAQVVMVTGFSLSTVRRRMADGSLRSIKVGRARRVHRKWLDAYMRRGSA